MRNVFSPSLFAKHRYAVLGLGKNGAAVSEALLNMGANVQAWDDEKSHRGQLAHRAGLSIAPFDDLTAFDSLILSPGIPHLAPNPHPVSEMARKAGIPIWSDAEVLYRAVRASHSKARFVSITGTNGKSTVTALLGHILAVAGIDVAIGGNIGRAALDLPLLGDEGVYVIEMSSYMLERLDRFHADAASLLNLTPDHLDRHQTMEHYRDAKLHAFDHMSQGDAALLSIDDPWCHAAYETLRAKHVPVLSVSCHLPADVTPAMVDLKNAPFLVGKHNLQNALHAYGVARHLGVSRENVRRGLQTYPGLAHRQQICASNSAVTFINDSKATNAQAAETALVCYPRVIWIAGGLAKAGGIDAMKEHFHRIEKAFLIGKDGEMFTNFLRAHNVDAEYVSTLENAVDVSFYTAQERGVPIVLFSPACASLDQFTNFEERGVRFVALALQAIDQANPSQLTARKESTSWP